MILNTFYDWLNACLSWFIPSTILEQPIVILINDILFYVLGLYMLYLLIGKPLIWLFSVFTKRK